MKKLSDIDTNFRVNSSIERAGLKFFNPEEKPFVIYGVFREGEKFRRMPEAVAKSVSEGVLYLHANTAGGRIRFITDSPYVAISAKMGDMGKMSHFPLTGSIGFDIYADDEFVTTFVPPYDIAESYEGVVDFPNTKKRLITVNMPLYSEVKEVYIGLCESAELAEPTPYKNDKPVVFYGSSITQGGCASRAGMAYEAIVSRRFSLDYINLGFSGNAKGEDEMIDYIKNLEMSAFVLDYDYNAPTAEHLAATHEKLFKAVREKHPDIPVIIMSKPKYNLNDNDIKCRSIIEATYNNAKMSGDNNVYFLDNKDLTALCGNEGTVEGVHPTDFGFASMAKAVGDLMEKISEQI